MKLFYILLQGISYNHAGILNICKFILGWESGSICNVISHQTGNQVQDLCLADRCGDHREYFIHNIENSSNSRSLRLINHHTDHAALTLCTSHVHTCGVTDTAVGNRLYAIQVIGSKDFFLILRLRIWQLYRCIALASLRRSLHAIIIHKYHFRIGKRDIKTAKSINCRHHGIKINSHIISDVQIQHSIQHGNRLLRAAICISCICLGIGILSDIQKGIPVYRCKLHLFGIIIDTCNNNGITVLCRKRSVLGTRIDSKQCICGVAGHLRSCYICNDLTLIQLRCLNLVQSGINLSVYIQAADKQHQTDNFQNKQSNPLFSTRSCHLFFLSQYAFLLTNPLKIVINMILISRPTLQFSI